MKRLVCCVVVWAVGCVDGPRVEPFAAHYNRLVASRPESQGTAGSEVRVTLSADGMPAREFFRFLADRAGVSIVGEGSIDEKPVTLEVVDEPVSKVIGVAARRLGVQVTTIGRLYYLGALRPEDRGVLVRRVVRLSGDELASVVKVYLSENGRVQCYADGTLVVGDRVEVLERLGQLFDVLETVTSPVWVAQVYLVSCSRSDLGEFGLESVPALEVALAFARESGGVLRGSVDLAGGLGAVLRATRERGSVKLVAAPLVLLLDGEHGRFSQGERIPLPRRVVSSEGTVSTSGWDYIDAGLDVELGLRELGGESARVDFNLTVSAVTGYVEGAPVTSRRELQTVVACRASGVYLLGLVGREDTSDGGSGWFGTVVNWRQSMEVLQVWLRVYRVGGPALVAPAPVEVPQSQPSVTEAGF